MKFYKSFEVYTPEAYGFRRGMNNGHYARWVEFKVEDGKYYIKYSSSGDGDMFPFPGWEEVELEEFLDSFESAAIAAYEEEKLLEEWEG